jgi:hypothetical protein
MATNFARKCLCLPLRCVECTHVKFFTCMVDIIILFRHKLSLLMQCIESVILSPAITVINEEVVLLD